LVAIVWPEVRRLVASSERPGEYEFGHEYQPKSGDVLRLGSRGRYG